MGKEPEPRLRYYKPAMLTHAEEAPVLQSFKKILWSGRLTSGECGTWLAEEIGEMNGYEYAIPFGQCTHAIFVLARWFKHLGYKRLWTPAFTWPSTWKPFAWCGYDIRFVDIDKETWLPVFPKRFLQDTLMASVDTFGNVIPDSWNRSAWVDSAQSLGAKWDSTEPHRVVSLSASKIVTSAEGGVLLTQDAVLARFARETGSWFSRMNELEASLGIAYLRKLPGILKKKARIAVEYRRVFPELQWQLIPLASNNYIVAALVENRETFIRHRPGVEFRKYYSPAVNEIDMIPDSFPENLPNTRYVAERVLSFPSWPDMPFKAIERMR